MSSTDLIALDSAFRCYPRGDSGCYLSSVRVLVLSHHALDPANRQKLRELAGNGWEITLATPGGDADMDGPIRLSPVAVTGSVELPDTLQYKPRALKRLLSDLRPALVHVELEPGTQGASALVHEALKLEIPSVVFSWESLPKKRGYFEERRYRRTLSEVSGVIGGNRLAENILAEAAPNVPAMALPQQGIVAPPMPDRPSTEALTMATVGRLVPERGVDRLLRACGQLMGPWSLLVAGTGPEQESLEDLAQKLGLASRIRWLGPIARNEIMALWRDVDVIVSTSRSTETWVERHSTVVLEAMAHGVAPVVSNNGALPELVGEAGIVVSSDEELLIALQELVMDHERRALLGQAGRKRVLDYYVDAAIARTTSAYWHEVLARAHAGTPQSVAT